MKMWSRMDHTAWNDVVVGIVNIVYTFVQST